MAAHQRELMEILAISADRAAALLEEAQDMETAIALHFANPGGIRNAPRSPRTELVSLLGDDITRQQAQQLLSRAGGSVAAAADLYFQDPAAAGPNGTRGSGGGVRRQRRGSQGDPITISESRDAGESEDDTEEEEEVPEEADGEDDREEGEEHPWDRQAGGSGASHRRRVQQLRRAIVRGPGRGRGPASARDPAGDEVGDSGGGRGLVRSPRRAPPAPPLGLGGAVSGSLSQRLASLMGAFMLVHEQAGGYGDEDDSMSEYTLDSSDVEGDYSESDDEPPTPRLGPRVTAPMPDLNAAAADWAQAQALQQAGNIGPSGDCDGAGPSTSAAAASRAGSAPPSSRISPEPVSLPLSHLRRGGRLFSASQDAVPAVVRPEQELSFPLHLGSVVLPLATLDESRLQDLVGHEHWRGLEWGGKSNLFHDYLGPAGWVHFWDRGGTLPLSVLAGHGYGAGVLEGEARLALYGTDRQDEVPVAVVREERSWVSEFVHALWVLETAGIADVRISFVNSQDGTGVEQEEQQQGLQQQQAAMEDAGQQQEQQPPANGQHHGEQQQQQRGGSPTPEPTQAAAAAQLAPSGQRRTRSRSVSAAAEQAVTAAPAPARKGPMRGVKSVARPASTADAADAGGGGDGTAAASQEAVAGEAGAAAPRGVCVEVYLTDVV